MRKYLLPPWIFHWFSGFVHWKFNLLPVELAMSAFEVSVAVPVPVMTDMLVPAQ